jgi:hypothetical protein
VSSQVEVPKEQYGQFYGGDSYIVLYAYKDPRGKEAWLIYFWQGKASSNDEKGASALLAKELDDSMGGAPVQVLYNECGCVCGFDCECSL